MALMLQFPHQQGGGVLGQLSGQLSRDHIHEGERQRLSALRQVRVQTQKGNTSTVGLGLA